MTIQSIHGYGAYEYGRHNHLKKVKSRDSAGLNVSDTVNITGYSAADPAAEKKIEDRGELLNSVRERIKAGFYNSRKVIEDLGDTFAKAFDK